LRKILAALLASLIIAIPVFASEEITVDRTMDFFVVVNEATRLEVTTQLCDTPEVLWCERAENGGHFMDSALWLYNSSGQLMVANDDDGLSWASIISIDLLPGFYRLRAGRFFCTPNGCMNPEAPFPAGGYYKLISNLNLVLDPNPPVASPNPIPSELPTPEPTPTPTEEPTVEPSIDPTPSPTPDPSPSLEPSPSPTETPTPTPSPTSRPTPAPTPPTPNPSPPESPSPTPEPPPIPTEPPPSVEPTAPPTEPPPPDPIETVEEAIAAVGEAVAAAADATIGRIARLGQDLTPSQKEEAKPIAVAIIVSQAASSAVAVALSKRSPK
jgi:hypothetical protein